MLFLSHPERIFTVTGTPPSLGAPPAASTTVLAILYKSSGSFVKTEPAPDFTIFGTGHPQFISIHSHFDFSKTICVASFIESQSPPKI